DGRARDVGVEDRHGADGGRDQQVEVGVHRLDRVVDGGAHHGVRVQLGDGHPIDVIGPAQVTVREVVAVLPEEVKAVPLQVLERVHVDQHDLPAPQVTELTLVIGQ